MEHALANWYLKSNLSTELVKEMSSSQLGTIHMLKYTFDDIFCR